MNGGILIAAAFVFVGLSVVVLAMRGGPRSGPRQGEPSRDSRRFTWILVTALTIGGLVGPYLIITHNDNSRSEAAPGGKQLTAGQAEGRHLFARNCATCHSLDDANAVGRVGPDLDVLRPAEALTINAIEKGRAQGNGQMPKELLSGSEAEDVAKYIERVAGR